MEVKEFLAVIKRCLTKCLWNHLPSLVHPGKMFMSSNVGVYARKKGGRVRKKFHKFVPSLVLNLNSLMESLGYFVGKLFSAMEGEVLGYYKDLEGSMMVISVC